MLPEFYDDVRAALAQRAVNHPVWERLTRTPLSARFTKYSIGALIAFMLSNITFAIFYVMGEGTTFCSIAGFLGGAIPNWVLTRRWAWSLTGRPPVRQWGSYIVVSIIVLVSTSAATGFTDAHVKSIPPHYGLRALIVTAAFVFVQLVMFVAKFLVYEYWVFAPSGRVRARLRSLRQVPRTARANRIP